MKFIHSADIHLDSSASKLKRMAGQQELSISKCQHLAFQALIDLALKEEVDFAIISGDLFDANWKDYSVGLLFIQEIKRLSCPIYYIRGNHDSENRLLKKLPYPNHFHIFESESPNTYINEELKVAIHGQSYSHFHIEKDLSKEYPQALQGYFNIGLLHTSGEVSNGETPYAPYVLRSLEEKNYDYWALGHVHTAQILSKKPYRVYSGVIQGRHIKEAGEKGCYLVEVREREVTSIEFRTLASFIWEEVHIDLTGVESEERLKKVLLEAFLKKAKLNKGVQGWIIRVVFWGSIELEKKIGAFEEYWRSCIYLWLSQECEKNIYIEKLIDRTYPKKSHDLEKNAICKSLEDELWSKNYEKWVEEVAKDEKNEVFQKLPKEILEYMEEDQESIFQNVKQYITYKLEEIIHENSSS